MMGKSKAKSRGNVKPQIKILKTPSVVVDSNLFILYLVGIFRTIELDRFEKTREYGEAQFNLLLKVLGSFKKIIITQPVLTEATNHLDKLNRKYDYLFYKMILNNLLGFEDQHNLTATILNGTAFFELGFADSSLELLSKEHVILTNDDDLYGHIISQRGKVLYWKHLDPSAY